MRMNDRRNSQPRDVLSFGPFSLLPTESLIRPRNAETSSCLTPSRVHSWMLPTRSVGEFNPNAAVGHSALAEGKSFLSAVHSELVPIRRCSAPIPTKSFDEQDAGREAARLDIHRRYLCGQCGVLCRHDF
jgi:hypothetical protein